MLKKSLLKKSIFALFWVSTLSYAEQVAVSNYPLFLLSQEVTKGTHDAKLLLEAGDVGHHGSLSPSKVKLAKEAKFVVWFGRQLEQNLVNSLETAPNAISLFNMNAFYRLPLRDVDGQTIADSFDPHIWLDPTNAKAIVAALTVIHSHANPDSREVFQKNAQEFYVKIDALTLPKTPRPYWAYHDAYQYLERPLKLEFKGALTPDHHLSPKASRFRTLNDNRPLPTMCLASQIPVSDGIKTKLSPINSFVRQEDMSDDKDFLSAWQGLQTAFDDCIGKK